MKTYIVGGQKDYDRWIVGKQRVGLMEEADLVIFTGGEDVSPSIYGEPRGRYTGSNLERDLYEKKEFIKAVELNKPILGICRGSQFSCAMSGGRLVQHQRNPSFTHPINTVDGKKITISSTHHQAQYPYNMEEGEDYKLIAWTEGASPFHLDGTNEEINEEAFKEAEIVYYPKTRALGIQGHPEMMERHQYPETFEYLDNLVNNLVNQTI